MLRCRVLRVWRGSTKSTGLPGRIGSRVVPRLHVLLARPPRRTITGLIKGTWSSPDNLVFSPCHYDDEGSVMGSLWHRLVDIGGIWHPPPLLWAIWPEDLDAGCRTTYTKITFHYFRSCDYQARCVEVILSATGWVVYAEGNSVSRTSQPNNNSTHKKSIL